MKKKQLLTCLFFDSIGMASTSVPLIGPLLDVLWAPLAAKKMTQMFPGRKGKFASVIVFIEEILPLTDLAPSFTLMWLYTYVWKKEQQPATAVF